MSSWDYKCVPLHLALFVLISFPFAQLYLGKKGYNVEKALHDTFVPASFFYEKA
jgi:hypothetical protein